MLGCLVVTPSLLSRVIKSKRQDSRIVSTGTGYSQVQVTRAGTSTQMVVFGIEDG